MSSGPRVLRRSDYAPPPFLIDTVHLRFEIVPGRTRVRGELEVRRNPRAAAASELVLDGVGLELAALEVDGTAVAAGDYRYEGGRLHLRPAGERFRVVTEVAIDPDGNTALEGLYRTAAGYLTQCEPEGFRKITFYLDRPDVLARFRTEIVADPDVLPVLLANGNLVASDELADGRRRVVWDDPFPKPCYLFALVAARFGVLEDSFVTRSGRRVQLRIYSEERNLDKCGFAMQALQRAMAWDEATYGLECDLDNYSVVVTDDFNMGAMENKGLNVFNSQYVLASPATATDSDYAAIEGVIGHEYFHNWTGNRVTCRDWFQLSLKEGLTVFRDQQFSAAMGSAAVKRIEVVRRLRAAQFPEDAGPMAHPVRPDEVIEINNFYTATVYEKGAEVVRMYHTLLGSAGFRRGMDLYFSRHDGQAVTCDDFRQAMADANGRDLSRFERWYSQAGTPVVEVSTHHDAGTATFTLELGQRTPPTPGQETKQPVPIPVAVGLLDAAGGELPLRLRGEAEPGGTTRVVVLDDERQRFEFVGVPRPPIASLLRGFSAPVQLRFRRGRAELAFLLAHDPDAFQRWDAGQQLALEVLVELVGDSDAAVPDELVDACRRLLVDVLHGDPRSDRALAAEVLTFPSEGMIGDALERVDPEAIHRAREHLRRTLGDRLAKELRDLHDRLAAEAPAEYRPDGPDRARRALRHVCLGYRLAAGDPAAAAACRRQLETGRNMTDRIGALLHLVHEDVAGADEALARFHADWQHEPLVVDKWLRIQASAPAPATLDRVRALRGHAAFSIKNPNKVRALIGAFAGNPVAFHRRDGQGYRFVADHVLELDALNPQIAARLLAAAFSRWRRFEPVRQAAMRAELERVAAAELSPDTYEIAAKALG